MAAYVFQPPVSQNVAPPSRIPKIPRRTSSQEHAIFTLGHILPYSRHLPIRVRGIPPPIPQYPLPPNTPIPPSPYPNDRFLYMEIAISLLWILSKNIENCYFHILESSKTVEHCYFLLWILPRVLKIVIPFMYYSKNLRKCSFLLYVFFPSSLNVVLPPPREISVVPKMETKKCTKTRCI